MTLAELRARLNQLTANASAKRSEITADVTPEDAVRLEKEHGQILVQISQVRAQIAELEGAGLGEPTTTPPAEQRNEPSQQPADVEAVRAAERTRIATIQDIGRRAGMEADVIQNAVTAGTAVEAFRTEAFTFITSRQTETRGTQTVEITRDETEARRDGYSAAIVFRLQRAGSEPGTRVECPENARQYAEMGFAEMAAECVGYRGQLRTARQVHDVVERAFHTLSDFPGIFVDAMNTRLLQRYRQAPATYRLFCALYTATDFRPTHVIRAGDFPALQAVNEAGEIKAGTFSESKEIFRVYPYGVKFNITRQMIVNDSLRAIDQMLGSAGERVADWENTKAFEKLLEGGGLGPTLATDSKRIFHADHTNLASAAAVPSITSVGIGRASMMKQTTLDGIKANFTPRTLLTGPDHLLTAEQLVTQITPAQASNAIPEFIRRLVPVGDANITGNPWYLFADPAIAPCFVYGYLEGFEGPRLSSEEVFDVQGLRVKLEHDFGVEGIDFRGGFRNAGAAS